MFGAFDYPRTITKIVVTEETVDQATGEITPASEADPVAITGHVSDLTQKELSYLDTALVKQGVRKFATSSEVDLGDVVRITESDSSSTDWAVEQLIHETSLVQKYAGEKRKTFYLKKRL